MSLYYKVNLYCHSRIKYQSILSRAALYVEKGKGDTPKACGKRNKGKKEKEKKERKKKKENYHRFGLEKIYGVKQLIEILYYISILNLY